MGRHHGAGGKGRPSPAAAAAQRSVDTATEGRLTISVLSTRKIATLWAGYGSISEVESEDEGQGAALILKEVAPPPAHGVSHERKLRSYQVEAAFYQRVAPHLPADAACHMPRCLGVHSTLHGPDGGSADGGSMQLVLSDLRPRFPSSSHNLDEAHARAALSWLGAFHAACWGADAAALGLWPQGTYWHLETRQEELAKIGRDWCALQVAATEIDARLRATPFRTLVHGQYVGGGSGLSDVVYLLVSGVQGRLVQGDAAEEALLRHYHSELRVGLAALAARGGGGGGKGGGAAQPVGCPARAAEALENYGYEQLYADYRLAMLDYVRFMAGWGFWGTNTSWAERKARLFLQQLGLG
eukprot:scaffold17.g427.t1